MGRTWPTRPADRTKVVGDWSACAFGLDQWISGETTIERDDRAASLKWIWTAGENALHQVKEGSHHFQLNFSLEGKPVDGTLLITAKDTVSATINGNAILQAQPPPPGGHLSHGAHFARRM